jgi:hypothetical protein
MNYIYPSDVFIIQDHTRPDLHVRLYLDRVLQGQNKPIRDPSDNNSYINDNITADQVDGKGGETGSQPLIMPRLTSLDKDFRTTKIFEYGLVLKDLGVGYYKYTVEFREPDKKESGTNGNKRIIGDLIEFRRGEFLIEHSPFDRVICIGNDQENKPVYKSFGEMILANYRFTTLNSTVNGIYGDTDLVINAGNLKDGEILTLQLMEGDPKIMAKGYKKEITVENGQAILEKAPDGKYSITVNSNKDRFIIRHPENC